MHTEYLISGSWKESAEAERILLVHFDNIDFQQIGSEGDIVALVNGGVFGVRDDLHRILSSVCKGVTVTERTVYQAEYWLFMGNRTDPDDIAYVLEEIDGLPVDVVYFDELNGIMVVTVNNGLSGLEDRLKQHLGFLIDHVEEFPR